MLITSAYRWPSRNMLIIHRSILLIIFIEVRFRLPSVRVVGWQYKHAIYTVYALTFVGLNFRGFHGSATIRKSFT